MGRDYGSNIGYSPYGGNSGPNIGYSPYGGNSGQNIGYSPYGGNSGQNIGYGPYGGNYGPNIGYSPYGGSYGPNGGSYGPNGGYGHGYPNQNFGPRSGPKSLIREERKRKLSTSAIRKLEILDSKIAKYEKRMAILERLIQSELEQIEQ